MEKIMFNKKKLVKSDVKINDNVTIFYNAFIGPGVEIGANSIIGANCVITKDVPPNTIVNQQKKSYSFKSK